MVKSSTLFPSSLDLELHSLLNNLCCEPADEMVFISLYGRRNENTRNDHAKIFLWMINHPISFKHHKLTPHSTQKAFNVELKRWQMIYIHLESYDKQHTKKKLYMLCKLKTRPHINLAWASLPNNRGIHYNSSNLPSQYWNAKKVVWQLYYKSNFRINLL